MKQKQAKENTNIYYLSRDKADLTREEASDRVHFSTDRIEKIENRGSTPHPDEVLAMAKAYRDPTLCNYYCSHECLIGQAYVPEVKLRDVSQITLEVLACLNQLTKEKDRLIEITVDGVICEEELHDFQQILNALNRMGMTIDALKLWVEHQIAAGKIDEGALEP